MATRDRIHAIAGLVLVGALAVLAGIWWMNGREETWFYAICAIIVLTVCVPLLSKKNQDKGE